MAERVMLSLQQNPDLFSNIWDIAKKVGSNDSQKRLVAEVFADGKLTASEYRDLNRYVFRVSQGNARIAFDENKNPLFVASLRKFWEQYNKGAVNAAKGARLETLDPHQALACVSLYDKTKDGPVTLAESAQLYQQTVFDLYLYFSVEENVNDMQLSGKVLVDNIVKDGKIEFAEVSKIGLCKFMSDN